MPKVSVIIPVYGVEKYIERCARSLFEQTLEDIEFIFVNDCTKDRSIEILERVLERYPSRRQCVKIIHHDINKGLPFARKTGINNASGEYIAHCDSDDWVDTQMYQLLYENAQSEDADLVVCDYYRANDTYKEQKKGLLSTEKRAFLLDLMSHRFAWGVWNRLTKKSLYDKVVFPENNQAEDMALMTQIAFFVNKISYIDQPLYYYFDNPASMCKTTTRDDLLRSYKQVAANVTLLDSFFEDKTYDKSINSCLLAIKLSAKNKLLPYIWQNEVYRLWRNSFSEINSKVLWSKSVSFESKIKFLLTFSRIYSIIKYVQFNLKK